jgi:hypothetical protein
VLCLLGALSDERTGLQFTVQSPSGPSRAGPVIILYCLILYCSLFKHKPNWQFLAVQMLSTPVLNETVLDMEKCSCFVHIPLRAHVHTHAGFIASNCVSLFADKYPLVLRHRLVTLTWQPVDNTRCPIEPDTHDNWFPLCDDLNGKWVMPSSPFSDYRLETFLYSNISFRSISLNFKQIKSDF